MSLERFPQLGTKPVSLVVKLPTTPAKLDTTTLADGLREFYKKGEFTDVSFLCAGQTFLAHKVVLASQSEVLKEGLATSQPDHGVEEVRLAEVSNPEAVRFMLDYLYQVDSMVLQEYDPRTQAINKDVLSLARNFRLPGLTEMAAHWLAKDITTANVVERLTICEDFGLTKLRERIIEQLTLNRLALIEVASSPQIMQHPKLMQELLQQAAAAPDPQPKPAPMVEILDASTTMATNGAAKKKVRKV